MGQRRRRRLMRRLEIRLVNLEPAMASEAASTRPAAIVSNGGANTAAARLGRGAITVVPVTSNTHRAHPFQVLLPAEETGLVVDSKAQAEQVRSVAIERLGKVVGSLSLGARRTAERDASSSPCALENADRQSSSAQWSASSADVPVGNCL